MKNIDISAITDRNPDECFIVVFDSDLNYLGGRKPVGFTMPATPELPPVQSEAFSVLAEFIAGKIEVVTAPKDGCLVSIVGLSDWTNKRTFDVPAYQVKEGVEFTVKAKWPISGIEKAVSVSTAIKSATDEVTKPVEPVQDIPAVEVPPANVVFTHISEVIGNRNIFDPAVEFNRAGLARIVNRNNPENLYYWIAGGTPSRELETDYVYAPGDQVSIYAAVTDNPDVFYGNFLPAFSIVTIPDNVNTN